jgi:GTPase SAR1 family protein
MAQHKSNNIAILPYGLPGIGKSSITNQLVRALPNTVVVEQDSFYKSNKVDVPAFLNAIEIAIQSHNVIVGKNFHTEKSRYEVIDLLKKNNIQYIIFNFVPENFKTMSKDEQNVIIDILVDRITLRADNNSPLRIDPANLEESRAAARRKIIFGFVKSYENPQPNTFIQLNYLTSLQDNLIIIIQLLCASFSQFNFDEIIRKLE